MTSLAWRDSVTRRTLGLCPIVALAFAACIPDQGGSYAPDMGDAAEDAPSVLPGDDGSTPAEDAGDSGATDAQVVSTVTRKVFGTVDDKFQFTDENGKPSGPNLTNLYVPAGSHVHFVLTSDSHGEVHKFMITSPPLPAGFASPDISMPATKPATYDWVAPSTPATYAHGITCDVHKGMVADLIVQ